MGTQWQHALWCTVCHGSKRVDVYMTPRYVWFDQARYTDFATLEGLRVDIIAGPSSDCHAMLAAALRDHESRRIAYMRESIDRELASHDWSQYNDEKAARIRDLVERNLLAHTERLRSAVELALKTNAIP